MEKEHVFPISKGGRGITNKVLSCKFCNRLKSNLTIEEFKMKIEELILTDNDNRYSKILMTLNKLLNGEKIRDGWHKNAHYKSNNINNIPIKV
jgi:hypothetical protein